MRKFDLRFIALLLSTQFLFSCAYLFYDEDEGPETPTVQQQEQVKTSLPPVSVSPKNVQIVPPVKIVEAPTIKPEVLSGSPVSANVKAAHVEVEKQLAKIQDEKKQAPPALEGTPTNSFATGKSPEQALGWLKNGNTRFLKNRLRSDGQSMADVKKLATEGAKPHTIVLACSDAVVPPEIIFDQKLGEIYVIRTAGESLDSMGVGSIEYALTRFGTRHVLILGHTKCGSVSAACAAMNGGNVSTENANAIVKDIGSRLQAFKGKMSSENLTEEAWANVTGIAEDLPKRSGVIAFMMKNKDIQISTAVYNTDTGKVDFK